MKITMLIDGLGFGGAQRQMVNLAIELKRKGHSIRLVRYRRDDFYLPLLTAAAIEPFTVESKNILDRVWKIRHVLKDDQDIVISFMGAPNLYASFAKIGRKKWKLIISERIANESLFIGFSSKLKRIIQLWCANHIICNSFSAMDMWKKYLPRSEPKLSVIYNIVEVKRESINFSQDGKCRIVVAARYEAEKNLSAVIESVSSLCTDDRKKLELHWFGKENIQTGTVSVKEEGIGRIKELGLEHTIFLHREVSDIHHYMASADYVALFSRMEGLPNAVLEGMALKKPIIMSRVSDYTNLVNNDNGFTCDAMSYESISKAIHNAIQTSVDKRIEMGIVSYNRVTDMCSKDRVIQQWESIISK